MKLKNKSRRDFLKSMGLAAGMAVPLLNSEVAMGQTATAPTRLLVIALQHGWGVDKAQAPVGGGEFNYTFPPALRALEAVRDQCVVIDSLRTSYNGNAHDISYSDILTCAVCPDAPTSDALGGPFMVPKSASLDWMIGNHFNKGVLRLNNGYRSFGAQYHPLCFDNNLRSLPFYTTARDAYTAIIDPLRRAAGTGVTPVPAANADEALMRMLKTDANALLSRVEGTPRARMQSYLTAMTELGNRILGTGTTPPPPTGVTLPALPGLNLSFANQLDSYLEMIKVSFQLDTHRVAVLGLGEGDYNFTWTDVNGVPRVGNTFGGDFHHDIAHYNENANPRAAMAGWTNWYAQKVAAFVQQLKTTIDVDGRPMIDNTIIVLTGEVGNGNHDRENFAHIVIGGGGQGRIRRNRAIRFPTFDSRNRNGQMWCSRRMDGSLDTCDINYMPMVSTRHAADLWVSILRLMGLNINTFGFDVYNTQPIQLT